MLSSLWIRYQVWLAKKILSESLEISTNVCVICFAGVTYLLAFHHNVWWVYPIALIMFITKIAILDSDHNLYKGEIDPGI